MKKTVSVFICVVILLVSAGFFRGNDYNADAASGSAPHGITVVYNGDIYSQRGLTWVTGLGVGSSYVELLEAAAGVTAENADWNSSSVRTFNGSMAATKGIALRLKYNCFKALITGMEEGKSYFYRIVAGEEASDVGTIKIDTKGSPVTFINVTDPQEYTAAGYQAAAKVMRTADAVIESDIDFYLCNGDNSNNTHDAGAMEIDQWNYLFNEGKDTIMNYPFMSIAGNHESADYAFSDRFNYKWATQSEESFRTGGYYSFEYENVFFAFLNTNLLDTAQLNWLTAQLQQTTAQWKVVVQHKTAITTSEAYYPTTEPANYRARVFPIMAKNNVDIFLQGHSHVYLRTAPYGWGNTDNPVPVAKSSYSVYTEFFEGNPTNYMVEPDGTVSHIINYMGNKQHPIATAWLADEENGTSVTTAGENDIKGGKSTASPDLPMFSAFTIENNKLSYRAYTVDRSGTSALGQADLFDTYGIVKDTHLPVVEMLNALPEAYEVSFEDAIKLKEAKDALDALYPKAKAKVPAILQQKLAELMDIIDVDSAVKVLNVENLIIGLGTISLSSKIQVEAVVAAYTALSPIEKQMVRNSSVLTEAQSRLNDFVKADEVVQRIGALDSQAQDFETKVAEARTAYNRLNSAQRQLVNNYSVLTGFEKEIEEKSITPGKTGCGSAVSSFMLVFAVVFVLKFRIVR